MILAKISKKIKQNKKGRVFLCPTACGVGKIIQLPWSAAAAAVRHSPQHPTLHGIPSFREDSSNYPA